MEAIMNAFRGKHYIILHIKVGRWSVIQPDSVMQSLLRVNTWVGARQIWPAEQSDVSAFWRANRESAYRFVRIINLAWSEISLYLSA